MTSGTGVTSLTGDIWSMEENRAKVDSAAVSIFVVILIELTNKVFVNSTNITTNVETAALSICFPLLSCSSTSEHFTDFSLLAHESVALEEYSDGKLSRRGPL